MAEKNQPLVVVHVRHYRRWLAVFAVGLGLVMTVHGLWAKIPTGQQNCAIRDGQQVCTDIMRWRFQWDVVGQYFTNQQILHGLVLTLELTVLTMIMGVLIGVLIAVMRLSPNRVLSSVAWGYTWFFRGTPVLVQLLFWFNIAVLFPKISMGIPFGPEFIEIDMVSFFTPFTAVLIGLGLNEGAYMSEIVRGGIQAVDEGQVEAASSIGLTRLQTLRLVVLPQAMRVIVPPTGNELISMLKTTSLASSVALMELLKAAQNIYSRTYQVMPLLIVASLWYLFVTTLLSIGQFYVERHFAKGALRTPPPTPIQRVRQDLRGILSKFRTPRGFSGVKR